MHLIYWGGLIIELAFEGSYPAGFRVCCTCSGLRDVKSQEAGFLCIACAVADHRVNSGVTDEKTEDIYGIYAV